MFRVTGMNDSRLVNGDRTGQFDYGPRSACGPLCSDHVCFCLFLSVSLSVCLSLLPWPFILKFWPLTALVGRLVILKYFLMGFMKRKRLCEARMIPWLSNIPVPSGAVWINRYCTELSHDPADLFSFCWHVPWKWKGSCRYCLLCWQKSWQLQSHLQVIHMPGSGFL